MARLDDCRASLQPAGTSQSESLGVRHRVFRS